MHGKFAGVVRKFFIFQKLKLNPKRGVLHFKCPRDFLVWTKLVNGSIETMFVSFRIGGFKLITAVLFIFELQHLCSHPLFNNFGFCVRFEKQFYRQIKFPRNRYFLFAIFGIYFCLAFHLYFFDLPALPVGKYFFIIVSSLLNRSSHMLRNCSIKSATSFIFFALM